MNIDEDTESHSFLDDSNVRGKKKAFPFPPQRQSLTKDVSLYFMRVPDLS